LGSGKIECESCGSVFGEEPLADFLILQQVAQEEALKASTPTLSNQKSAYVAALLAFFLGTYGVHNFYLGKIKIAVTQLLISIFLCITGLLGGLLAIVIWVWFEGLMFLRAKPDTKIGQDGKGVPLYKGWSSK
jgi:TM2 domain-containing membrane protein YozV